MRRLSISVCLVTILSLMLAAPALAVVPSNDTYAGRTAVGALPFSDALDTTDATTDADDAEWNATCGAPATDASVWYELTSASDVGVLVDTAGSDYTAGIAVVSGPPGSFILEACGPDAIGFVAASGVSYSIIVFDDQIDGAGNGGMLAVSIEELPPPPTVDITVDPTGTFDSHSGSATISGTVTCSGETELTFIDVELRQRAGRVIISGFGSTDFACDGATHEWSVDVIGQNGLFKGGKSAAVVFGVACGVFDCTESFQEASVKLKG